VYVRKKETSETKDRIECMSRLQREEGFLREGIERCGSYTSATQLRYDVVFLVHIELLMLSWRAKIC
jgi:hypothetical protein